MILWYWVDFKHVNLTSMQHFFFFFYKFGLIIKEKKKHFSSINTCILKGTRSRSIWSPPTFMTLNKLSWPSPSFSLKKSWSGKVRAMSLLISFSLGEVCFRYSTYSCLWGESCTPSNNCQARPRKWCGIPLLTSSCKIFFKNTPLCFGHLRDYRSLYLSVSLKLKLHFI